MNEDKIIKYSTQQFLSNGFKKITMDQLATGMKISKKTIYKYFPSKTKLIEAVFFSVQIKTKKRLDEIVNSDKSLIIKLEEVGEFFTEFSTRINDRLIKDFINQDSEFWETIDEFRKNILESVWIKLIKQGQKDGVIVEGSIKIIVRLIISSLRGIIDPKFLTENKINANNAFKQAFAIIINGILTEKGKEKYQKH